LNGILDRLKTDYLDLLLLHAPSRDVAIEKTMPSVEAEFDKGKFKHFGVSNFTVAQMERTKKATKLPIVTNQVHYSLKVREPEDKGVLQYCQENDMFLTTWQPLHLGELATGNSKIMNGMAKKYEKTPAQIAINWLISQKNVVTVSKMRDPRHLKENLGAVGWEMAKEDIERLRKEFPD